MLGNKVSSFEPLYAIFNGIDSIESRRISTFESIREVWDIFETTHNGTMSIKVSKIHKITKVFENLTMDVGYLRFTW